MEKQTTKNAGIFFISNKESFEDPIQNQISSTTDKPGCISSNDRVAEKRTLYRLGFPSFDDLFNETVEIKTVLRKLPSSFALQDKLKISESRVSLTQDPERPPPLKKQNSVMDQDFYTLLHRSWEGAQSCGEFRYRLGDKLNLKYFSCCRRVNDTIFLGIFVCIGFCLVCTGVMCILHCLPHLPPSLYLIVDGILSVFIFPILPMYWTIRIGGCAPDPHTVKIDACWYCVLWTRILLSIFGTLMIYYTYNDTPDDIFCRTSWYISLTVVVLEWTAVIMTIVIPCVLYGVLYCMLSIC